MPKVVSIGGKYRYRLIANIEIVRSLVEIDHKNIRIFLIFFLPSVANKSRLAIHEIFVPSGFDSANPYLMYLTEPRFSNLTN